MSNALASPTGRSPSSSDSSAIVRRGDRRTPNLATVPSADGTVQLWNAESGTEIGEPLHRHDEVLAVAFSPNGQRLATGSRDGTVRLWDVEGKREPREELRGHVGAVVAVAFSPNGQRLATTSADSTGDCREIGGARPEEIFSGLYSR
jgi:WD40 repeat protein